MKVTLTIELDLPDEMQEWSDEELAQVLFDEYVNYVPAGHIYDACKWSANAGKAEREGKSELEIIGAKHIATNAQQWYDITKDQRWSFKRG